MVSKVQNVRVSQSSYRNVNEGQPARGVFTIRRGIGFLEAGDYRRAVAAFQSISGSSSRRIHPLVKAAASFYAYNAERLREESEKDDFGNANKLGREDRNRGRGWSDVDIAAVIVAPRSPFTTRFLSTFLDRSAEAIRFQRRYVFGYSLPSWDGETGEQYTRATQARKVARKLGLLG